MSTLLLIACMMWHEPHPDSKLLALVELQRPCPVVKL